MINGLNKRKEQDIIILAMMKAVDPQVSAEAERIYQLYEQDKYWAMPVPDGTSWGDRHPCEICGRFGYGTTGGNMAVCKYHHDRIEAFIDNEKREAKSLPEQSSVHDELEEIRAKLHAQLEATSDE